MVPKKLLYLLLGLLLLFFIPSEVKADDKVLPVPLIGQERNLSCEAAAARMVLSFFGKNIPEAEILNSFGLSPDPNVGFRGNVDGPINGYTDYGVYANPVAKAIVQSGIGAQAVEGIDQELIKQKLIEGKPSIIWISGPKSSGSKEIEVEGRKVRLIAGEHTVVVVGFQNGQFILSDPWQKAVGSKRTPTQYRVRNLSSLKWGQFNNMAVIVD